MGDLIIRNCRLPGQIGDGLTSVLVVDGTIREVSPGVRGPDGCQVLDAAGRTAAPGFIDVHIQGAGGADCLEGTADALSAMATACAATGVTGFLATTVYKPGTANDHLRVIARNVGRDLGGARVLGIHLEGPFIAQKKRGMIQPDCICAPTVQALEDILSACGGTLRMMTLAPELPGCLEIIPRLRAAGVVCSFAHSDADYDQTRRGIEAGISHVTHLFNAMRGIHHRDPGPVPAIFENPSVTVQVIPDGAHLHEPVVRLAWQALGPRRFVTITDGVTALGLPEGMYTYNGLSYESKGGVGRYGDGTLIGTTVGLLEQALSLKRFTGCSLGEAIGTIAANPAGVLGLQGRTGTIAAGEAGDVVVLDDDDTVFATIVGGTRVYSKERTSHA